MILGIVDIRQLEIIGGNKMTNLEYVINICKHYQNTSLTCLICQQKERGSCNVDGCPTSKELLEWLKEEYKEKEND